jgi:hypothetical protein
LSGFITILKPKEEHGYLRNKKKWESIINTLPMKDKEDEEEIKKNQKGKSIKIERQRKILNVHKSFSPDLLWIQDINIRTTYIVNDNETHIKIYF